MRGRDLKLTAFALVFHAAAIAWSHVHPATSLEVAVGLAVQALTGLVVVLALALMAWSGPRWIFLGTALWMIGWALDAAVEIPLAAQLLELSAPAAPLDIGLAPMLCYALGGAIAAAGAIARTPTPRAPRLALCAVAFGLTTLGAVIAEHSLADAVIHETTGIAVARLVRDVLACGSLLSLAGISVAALKQPSVSELAAMRVV